MRKYLYIFIALIFIFQINYFCNLSPTFAQEEVYYRITGQEVTLYRTPVLDEDYSNIYFTLPTSYFVKFIAEENENFLKVQYIDFVGYVLKTDVTQVYSTPVTPYFTQTFTVFGTANPVVWSQPSTQSTYLGNIPFNAESVTCFGAINGEIALENGGSTWYFCRYTSFEQGILTGYVYANLTTNLSEFVENTEIVETEPSQETSGEIFAPELQNGTSVILIVGLCIFALILLVLVFKPERRRKKAEAKRQITTLNRLAIPDKNKHDELDF